MKKFFGFGSNTPPPPPPPSKPPSPPVAKPAPPAPAAAPKPAPSHGIVGQWKEPNGSDLTEFRADGTVIEKPANGETIRGRYSLEAGKLKVKLDGIADELSFSAVVKADALELTDAEGQVTRYQKAS